MNTVINLFLLILAALAVTALLVTWANGFIRPRRHLAANLAEGDNLTGVKTMIAVSAKALRFTVVKAGATANQVDIAAAADKPIGIAIDEMAVGEGVAVQLLGSSPGTKKVSINSTVTNDDWLTCDAAGYARTLPTANGTYWVFGRAVLPAATAPATDIIEFMPMIPIKVVVVSLVGTATFP